MKKSPVAGGFLILLVSSEQGLKPAERLLTEQTPPADCGTGAAVQHAWRASRAAAYPAPGSRPPTS